MGASMIETTDAALRAKVNGLEKQIDDTPQFAREYLGLWVLDAQALRKELEAERDKLVKERDALKKECDRQALLGSKANDEREELESERDKLRERNALLEARISNAGAGTIQVVEQNRWLKTVVADLRAQLSEATSRALKQKCISDLCDELMPSPSWYRDVENRISKLETRFEEDCDRWYRKLAGDIKQDRDEAVKERDDFLKRVEQRLDLLLNQPRSEASPSSPKPYTP